MRAGIFARTFARGTLDAALATVAEHGLRAVQFNLALAGGPSLPDALDDALVARVRAAVAAHGLDMVAISGTYNMAHPDPAARARGLRALQGLIARARDLGTGVVTLCTGTRDPDDMWRRDPANDTPQAWADMRASVAAAIGVAEAHAVTLAVEPEPGNVVRDARAARRLLDELRSERLQIVVDAANLLPPERLAAQDRVLADAFDLLGGDLVLAHAKDVLRDGTVVAAGRGVVDYPRYAALLRDAGYDGALVLHGLDEAEVGGAVAFLHATLRGAGALTP
ncbi:MAG TPA: sugar phosphate isomerase/epimerase [Solirubrobacteraceae bacterium]|nr:sugar phosphate isomerase/epimerase [Solirubrobacteraceae bacterium]